MLIFILKFYQDTLKQEKDPRKCKRAYKWSKQLFPYFTERELRKTGEIVTDLIQSSINASQLALT